MLTNLLGFHRSLGDKILMVVFRVEKNRNYTVMSNHHLKDKSLTLKSKGLLSMILSLPDEWNYTTRGLAAICLEGVDSLYPTTVTAIDGKHSSKYPCF
jgi:hypothetical protein